MKENIDWKDRTLRAAYELSAGSAENAELQLEGALNPEYIRPIGKRGIGGPDDRGRLYEQYSRGDIKCKYITKDATHHVKNLYRASKQAKALEQQGKPMEAVKVWSTAYAACKLTDNETVGAQSPDQCWPMYDAKEGYKKKPNYLERRTTIQPPAIVQMKLTFDGASFAPSATRPQELILDRHGNFRFIQMTDI